MSGFTSPFDEMDIVTTLLADGTEKGYVTYDQILEALPEVENNLPLLETVLEEIQAASIAIYESEEEASTAGEDADTYNGGAYF
jgi:hypothetical protein